jgi:hypothetical protein
MTGPGDVDPDMPHPARIVGCGRLAFWRATRETPARLRHFGCRKRHDVRHGTTTWTPPQRPAASAHDPFRRVGRRDPDRESQGSGIPRVQRLRRGPGDRRAGGWHRARTGHTGPSAARWLTAPDANPHGRQQGLGNATARHLAGPHHRFERVPRRNRANGTRSPRHHRHVSPWRPYSCPLPRGQEVSTS